MNATDDGPGPFLVRERLQAKLRRDGVARLFLDGLSRLGLLIVPFYLYREDPAIGPRFDTPSGNLEVSEVGSSDMAGLACLPERTVPLSSLEKRLAAGGRCLGVRCDGKVVAFRWFNLRRCVFECYRFELDADEAYTFDAYTAPAFRGKGLGLLLCAHLYRLLLADHRTTVYSVCHCLNRRALRFKARLGAHRDMLLLHVRVFGHPVFTLRLRRYRGRPARA